MVSKYGKSQALDGVELTRFSVVGFEYDKGTRVDYREAIAAIESAYERGMDEGKEDCDKAKENMGKDHGRVKEDAKKDRERIVALEKEAERHNMKIAALESELAYARDEVERRDTLIRQIICAGLGRKKDREAAEALREEAAAEGGSSGSND